MPAVRTVGIVRPLVGEHESPNPLLTLFPERARAVITSDRGGSAEYGFSNLVECHQGGAEIEALYEDDLQGFTQRALEGFTTVVVACAFFSYAPFRSHSVGAERMFRCLLP